MPICTEDLYEHFLQMEEHAAHLIDRCCFSSGLNAWAMLRNAYTGAFLPAVPGSYISAHCKGSHMLCHKKLTIPDAALSLLEQVPHGSCLYLSEEKTHSMRVEGKRFNPYLDPVAFAAQSAGIIPIKLQMAEQDSTDFLVPALEVPTDTEGTWLPLHKVEPFPLFDEYILLCLEHRVPPLHAATLLQYCMDIQAHTAMFRQILTRVQPAMVVLICYYSIPQQGLTLACHRLGIPCIEYQHGLQTRPHIPYNFTHIPAEGFATVPQWFFTWGESSTLPFQKAFAHQNYHRVATAGKPDYMAWKAGRLSADSTLLERLHQKTVGKKCICVPLSGDEYPLRQLPELIARSPDDWLWLVREHPLCPSSWLHIAPQDAHKVEREAATGLPRHDVLAHSQHMLTSHSSAALEALSLHGVQSTIIAPNGKQYFSGPLADGSMSYADTVDAALQSIQAGLQKYPYTAPVEHISKNTKILASLLRALAQSKRSSA